MSQYLSLVKTSSFLADETSSNFARFKGENMEQIKGLVEWFIVNGPTVAGAILGLLAVAETLVRLTPTQKDDTAVERIGKVIRKFFDMLGLPNKKSGGGDHVAQSEKEKDKAA